MMFNPASNEPGTPVSPAQDHLYLVVGQTFQVEPFIFLQLDMVHVKKKKMLTSERFSECAVAMQLHCKSNDFFQESEGFFQKSRSFLPKSTGFVHSFTYRSSGAVFLSSRALLVMAKQHSNGNGFHKCTLFFDAYCT